MMQIVTRILTNPQELIERGVWPEACEQLGLNAWSINEGLMDCHEEIALTLEQATHIGLRGEEPE